jgi:amino acid permease
MFLKKLRKKIIFFKEDNPEISIAIVAAVILLIVIFKFTKFIESDSGLSQNLYATLLGFFLDILLFGVLIVLINKKREKKLDIKRWQEEIDDYRHWNEKEATFRIVGNIKRLNGHAKTKLDLSYCYLKDAILGTDGQFLIDTVESRLSRVC